MSEVIVDVHSISSASGWYFTEFDALHPVMCFALVSAFSTDHPSLAPAKTVIALGKDIVGDLVGMTIESKHTDFEFRELEQD